MKPFNEIEPSPDEPSAPPRTPEVHVVRSVRPLPDEASTAPLRIEYSTTQVRADALARLHRQPAILRADRAEPAETFRMLRNQLLQRMQPEGHRLLAVTSARRIDGKSTTAANLALSIAAHYDAAVLLVDADLSGQGLQRLFGFDGAPGLCEHLRRGVPLAELLINPGVPRLVVLPATGEPVADSAELLATRAARQLFGEMKQRYQDRYIIVDLPPLLDTADALAFLPQVDTTLLVVEQHGTAVPDLETAAELLAPFNVVGTVLSPPSLREPAADADRRPWYRRWGSRRA
ncbi:MAG TPA: CpsD/CapB family tyrosine-protein kinase [Methylibium sp.]|nr:CpsD/CapB family tyrosine-protein kinase [Methylibium sp.]